MEYVAGFILQYLRSSKKFPEWGTVVVVFVVSALGFYLSPAGATTHDPRGFVNGLIPGALKMLGVVQATSSAANITVAVNPKLEPNPLIPVTDSV